MAAEDRFRKSTGYAPIAAATRNTGSVKTMKGKDDDAA